MANAQPPSGWEWAGGLAAAITALGIIVRAVVKGRLPGRRADPVQGFSELTERYRESLDSLTTENRRLRADLDAQDTRHEAEMARLRAEMANQDALCRAQLAALAERVQRLTAMLATHGIAEEAGA